MAWRIEEQVVRGEIDNRVPGRVVVAPSAAVMSKPLRVTPPVDEKLPGVMATPAGVKNWRVGPSEEKVSLTSVALCWLGKGPVGLDALRATAAGVAATEIASTLTL